MEIAGYLAALLMGLSLGIIGGGGSILTVPILVYLFKQDALTATTDSLFIVGITAVIGAIMNARQKMIDYRTGIIFAVPSFVGVYFSRQILLPLIPDTFYLGQNLEVTKSLIILASFAILMVMASRAMLRAGPTTETPAHSKQEIISIGIHGFLVGSTTGFVGAGGGFIIIPALVVLLNLPMRKAIGTSLAIIAANSLFGFWISTRFQSSNWFLIVLISAIGIVGLVLGHSISPRFEEHKLKKSFGYFVLTIGALILLDQISKL